MLTKIKMHGSWLKRTLWEDKRARVITIALAVVIILAAIAAVVFSAAHHQPRTASRRTTTATSTPAPEPVRYYSPLTGLEVADSAATKNAVTGVMIENSPDARPQSGLKDAGIVFEAIAEGGITRFAVLYQGAKPALIGPVRSVRPYYISWMAPFDAGIAHVGGSYNALQEVRNGQYRDLDQFFNASAYYRSTDRYAPHNVYTTNDRLDALNAAKGYTQSAFTGFARVDPKATPQAGTPATSIAVNISSALYNPSYAYDAASGTYPRSQNGSPHTDREGGQIAPKVVVVMKVDTTVGFEDGYREQMTVIGSGDVLVFQHGQVFAGTWNKAGQKDQLQFLDGAGKPILLDRGQTWVTAIPSGNSVDYK